MLPHLIKSPPPAPFSQSRVITISSGGMYTEKLVVDDLEMKQAKKVDAMVQYARDKRRQVAFTEHLASIHGGSVGFYTVHPGWTTTEGVKKSIPGFFDMFGKDFRSLTEGADGIVYLAMEEPKMLENGEFYLDRAKQAKHLALSGTRYDPSEAQRLCEKLDAMLAK